MTITTKALEYLLEQYEYYHRQIVMSRGEVHPTVEQRLIFQTLIDDPVIAVREAQKYEVPVSYSVQYQKWQNATIGTYRDQRISMNREAELRADAEEEKVCRKLARLIVKVGHGWLEGLE